MIPVSFSVLFKEINQDQWPSYAVMDSHFRRDTGQDPGDLTVARKELDLGHRVILLAHSDTTPVGFQRADLKDGRVVLGSVYVDPEYRRRPVQLQDAGWMREEPCFGVAPYLAKAAFLALRRAGYGMQDVEWFFHNDAGRAYDRWFRRRNSGWEPEVSASQEPARAIHLLKQTRGALEQSRQTFETLELAVNP